MTIVVVCCWLLRSVLIGMTILLAVWLGMLGLAAAGQKPPPIHPSPQKVLFAAQLYASTEVNNMLEIADVLRARGHKSEFFVIPEFQERIQARGHKYDKFPNPFSGEIASEFFDGIHAIRKSKDWYTYMTNFGSVVKATAMVYEDSLVALKERIEKDKPDVIFASMFADYAIDLATLYDIPLAIVYAVPLGNLAFYEDHPSSPDSFLWDRVGDHTSFLSRLRKVVRFMTLILSVSEAGAIVNAARAKHGIPTYDDPTTNWDKAAVIVAYSWGVDVSRRVRPSTHVVGFISTPYDEANDISEQDVEIKGYLDAMSGGVTYVALGTMGALEQEMFDELVTGLDNWTRMAENRGVVFALNDFGRQGISLFNVPSSIRLESWVNQKMILHHSNTKIFVTHAGLGSVSESIDAITPMFAFPLFGDQMATGYRLQEAGAALTLHWREEPVTAAVVTERLVRLSTDPSFVEATKRLHQISKREGGAVKAAEIVEDLMMFGPPTYLIPSNDSVDLFASTNLDVYFLILFVMGLFLYAIVALGSLFLCVGKKKNKIE